MFIILNRRHDFFLSGVTESFIVKFFLSFGIFTIKATYEKYSHMEEILPAMGYGDKQMSELEATINAADCDLVLIGTPIDLASLLKINKPTMRVRYELAGAAAEALKPDIQRVVG